MKSKKMFSGFIVAILSLVIAAFCFAGCSGGNTSESTGDNTSTSEQPSSSDTGSGDTGSQEQPVKKQFTVTISTIADLPF